MVQHVRKLNKKIFSVYYEKENQRSKVQFMLNLPEILLCSIKSYKQSILICIRFRFSFIILKIYKLPMQNLSTSPKKTDLNSEKKRLENRLQLQPNAATLQKILQFASSYRVEQINENQYVEWFLN